MLVEANANFMRPEETMPATWGAFGTEGELSDVPFHSPIDNFYMTDPISRNSETMAECTQAFVAPKQGKTGTHG